MKDYMMESTLLYSNFFISLESKYCLLWKGILTYLITGINDFLINSGWFTHPGKPLGREALLYVLAKKCNMEYERFMCIKKAVYMFKF